MADDKETTETPKEGADDKAPDAAAAAAADTDEKTADVPSQDETKDEPMGDAGKEEEPKNEDAPKSDEPTGRGRRARKSTQTYVPEEETKKERVIPEGKGEKLETMPNVVANFKKYTWSDPDLHNLYKIVFGQGKKKEFKKHLLEFSGLVYTEGEEEKEKEKILQKMYKLTMPELREAMDLVDIDRSADSFPDKKTPDKDALCNRFLEWLEKPKASGKTKKSPAKRKSTGSASSAKKAKKESKPSSAKKTATKKKTTTAKSTKATKKKAAKVDDEEEAPKKVNLNIPGVDIDKVREKVKSIVDNANREELTVKGVRKMLEDWLDTDLSDHKDAVRSLVMEVM